MADARRIVDSGARSVDLAPPGSSRLVVEGAAPADELLRSSGTSFASSPSSSATSRPSSS
jgi:hypothetical protein